MPGSECPECGEQLGAEETICPKCGWPHEEPAQGLAADAAGPAQPASGFSLNTLLVGVGIGLVFGLALGLMLGRGSSTGSAVQPEGHSSGGSSSAALPNDTLRLRERGWKQASADLCTGRFEVVTAPPAIKGLRFSVMDAEGNVIGSDKVSAPTGIKPHTMLELGFETGSCSKIQKWHVQLVK